MKKINVSEIVKRLCYIKSEIDERFAVKDEVNLALSNKANRVHTHAIGDVDGLNDILSNLSNLRAVFVEASDFPPATGEDNILYIVPTANKDNYCDVYIWNIDHFRKIGDTSVDFNLDDYVLASTLVRDYYNASTVDSLLSNKANSTHTHGMVDVTGLVSTLNGKSNVGHTHSTDDIEGLSEFMALLEPVIRNIPASISLTADKTVIQSGESATLTATVLNVNGEPCKGVEVSFNSDITNSLPHNTITNSYGVVEMTYNGQSIGDVDFTATVNGLNACLTVQDCIHYSSGASIDDDKWTGTFTHRELDSVVGMTPNGNNSIKNITLPECFTIEYRLYTTVTSTSSKARLFAIGTDANNGYLIGTNAGNHAMVVYNRTNGSNSSIQSVNDAYTDLEWNDFKIIVNQSNVSIICNGKYITTANIKEISDYIGFYDTSSNSFVSDFKIKPVLPYKDTLTKSDNDWIIPNVATVSYSDSGMTMTASSYCSIVNHNDFPVMPFEMEFTVSSFTSQNKGCPILMAKNGSNFVFGLEYVSNHWNVYKNSASSQYSQNYNVDLQNGDKILIVYDGTDLTFKNIRNNEESVVGTITNALTVDDFKVMFDTGTQRSCTLKDFKFFAK